MKYYIIAGEASGDLHASYLMNEIIKKDKNPFFRFWGGNLMLNISSNIVMHYKDLAYMGFLDVLKNINKVRKNLKICKNDIIDFAPDCVILVDYPGFNLRIAEFTKKNNIKTFYYISPKIWAWKKNRAKKIKKFIDKMFVIFPFEIDFYKQFDIKVIYTGNPNVDVIEHKKSECKSKSEFLTKHNLEDKKIIALLAGSRKQEINRLLPEMLKVVSCFPEYQFVIAGLSSLDKNIYSEIEKEKNVKLIFDDTYNLLNNSEVAVVTSGTATLETALFNIPQVVCYKTELLFYTIGKIILKINFISLVNIILQKKAVKEVIQKDISKNIEKELKNILNNKKHKEKILSDYKQLRKILGDKGSPHRTAKIIVDSLH